MDHDAPVSDHSQARLGGAERSAGPAVASLPPQHRRRPPRRRGARWFVWLIGCMLAVLVIALLACALVGGLLMGIAIKLANQVSATATSTQSFTVSDTPSLDIHNPSGRVQIQQGASDSVSVEITRTARDASQSAARADLEKIVVETTQLGNQITVTSDFPDAGFFAGSSSVNLLITVPPNANITADVTAGDVQVSGVSGLMEITGGAGDVTLQDVAPADGSRIQMASGSVTLAGAIVANTAIDISVSTGDVNLQLPTETAARLDARTNNGDIHISGWPIQPSRMNNVGAVANGTLGAQAAGTIRIRVDTGDITVSQV
jgi:DUF4097 and DUF4098 domain-containing protein YvlB